MLIKDFICSKILFNFLKIVTFIQEEFRDAIQDLDEEKLQINIEIIDRKTYRRINKLIDAFEDKYSNN